MIWVLIINFILLCAYEGHPTHQRYVLYAGLTCFMHEIFHFIAALALSSGARLSWKTGDKEIGNPNALAYVTHNVDDYRPHYELRRRIILCAPVIWECGFMIFGITVFYTHIILSLYIIAIQTKHIWLISKEILDNY